MTYLARLTWLTDLAMLIAITILIAIGFQAQFYVFSLFSGDSGSIYGSAFGSGFSFGPVFETWVSGPFNWLYLSLGGTILLLALDPPGTRIFLVRLFCVALSFFFLGDLRNLVLGDSVSVENVFSAFAVDAIAALLLSFSFTGLVATVELFFSDMETSLITRRVLAAASLVIGSLLMLGVSFFVISFFYRPVGRQIELLMNNPTHGFVFDKASGRLVGPFLPDQAPFVFVRNVVNTGVVNWRSPKGDLKVNWQSSDLGPVDKVDSQISGSMIQDCLLGGGFGSRRPDRYGMADHRGAVAHRAWKKITSRAR